MQAWHVSVEHNLLRVVKIDVVEGPRPLVVSRSFIVSYRWFTNRIGVRGQHLFYTDCLPGLTLEEGEPKQV